jgi:lipopolysaccharide transport system permease protein
MTAPSAVELSAEPVAADEDVEQAPLPVELPLWQPKLRERIAEAWHSRHLLPGMALSSVQTFQGRILGRGWFFLRPLWQVFGMALIFGGIFHATAPNGIPYVLFVVFGFQAFQLWRITIMYETVSSKQIKVARNLRIPLLLVPFAILGRVFARLSVYWLIAAVVLLYYWIVKGHLYLQLNVRLLVGVAGVALCLIFAMGIGLFTSVLYARARDVKYLLRFFLPVLMFLTPVYYSAHQLPGWAQALSQVNPLTGVVSMVQWGFLDAATLRPLGVLWSLGAIVLTWSFGLFFFNKLATRFLGVFRVVGEEEDDEDDML